MLGNVTSTGFPCLNLFVVYKTGLLLVCLQSFHTGNVSVVFFSVFYTIVKINLSDGFKQKVTSKIFFLEILESLQNANTNISVMIEF